MIVTEIKTNTATIRIHDEFYSQQVEGELSHLNKIITDSYKRRNFLESENKTVEIRLNP